MWQFVKFCICSSIHIISTLQNKALLAKRFCLLAYIRAIHETENAASNRDTIEMYVNNTRQQVTTCVPPKLWVLKSWVLVTLEISSETQWRRSWAQSWSSCSWNFRSCTSWSRCRNSQFGTQIWCRKQQNVISEGLQRHIYSHLSFLKVVVEWKL